MEKKEVQLCINYKNKLENIALKLHETKRKLMMTCMLGLEHMKETDKKDKHKTLKLEKEKPEI